MQGTARAAAPRGGDRRSILLDCRTSQPFPLPANFVAGRCLPKISGRETLLVNTKLGRQRMDYGDTLNDIEMAGGLTAGFDNAMRFMIEACNKMALPDHAKESLAVATRYVNNDASVEDLKTVRVRCWQSIKGRDCEFADPEVAAIRAVICTLFPRRQDADLFETLSFFEDVAVAAGISPGTCWLTCDAPSGLLPHRPLQQTGLRSRRFHEEATRRQRFSR